VPRAAVGLTVIRARPLLVCQNLRDDVGDPALIIADNQPYFVSAETDRTIPVHGGRRGLPHVEIEIRQDLVSDSAGEARWAARIVAALRDAERKLIEDDGPRPDAR
jgi:predicted N-formylglutamate amidohydrolase